MSDKVICNQAEHCSKREICVAAKPHEIKLCGINPCSFDALAECIPVIEDGFDDEPDLLKCSQSAMEMGK